MTLGNELKKYIPTGKTQKTVALELAEALRTVVGLQYSPDTAESRWSEALKGKLTGLRFFFETEPRMETSLEALGVPDPERSRLRQLIRGAMGGQTVLLDLRSAKRLSPATFGELRTWLLSIEGELQVTVGLSDSQYDEAPASFRECGARFERGDLTRLRETAAIIVSEEPVRPIERWLAVSFTAPLAFSPSNWRERLQEGADLGPLPKPTRPAGLIAEAAEVRAEDLPSGPLLRELMLALATGEQNPTLSKIYNGRTLAVRLALGKLLGVDVQATQDEWDQKRYAGVSEVDPANLPRMLLASRFTGAKLSLRVGNKVHLVNPTEDMKQRMKSLLHRAEDVVVHDEQFDRDNYLRQLRESASRLTQDEVFADPWLDAWLQEQYRDDEERLVARDGLMWLSQSKQLQFRTSEPVADWRLALLKLLSAVPERATLLIANTDNEFYFSEDRHAQRGTGPDRSHLRPFAPLVLSREATLLSEPEDTIPKSPADWALRLQRRLTPRPAWEQREERYLSPVKVAETQWPEADDLLARVLDTLAFRGGDAPARLTQGGWAHLLLGGGVVARLQIRRTGSAESYGSFLVNRGQHSTSELTRRIATHAAGWDTSLTRFGPFVPVNMRLGGGGLVADLSFAASALLGGFTEAVASAIAADA